MPTSFRLFVFIFCKDSFGTHLFCLLMRAVYSSQVNLLDFIVLLDLIRGSLQIKVSPVQFLQPSLFWSKYFSQSPVLRHPQRILLDEG
jgi:hypothetical protein